MATHSSVLAWRILGTGSLVGCCLWGRTESDTTEVTQQQQSVLENQMDSEIMRKSCGTAGKEFACQRRRHNRCQFHPSLGNILGSRKRQHIPIFFPGKFHGQRSLVAYGESMGFQGVRHNSVHMRIHMKNIPEEQQQWELSYIKCFIGNCLKCEYPCFIDLEKFQIWKSKI